MIPAEWTAALQSSLAQLRERGVEYLPSLLGAVLLLLAGWALARLLGAWTTRLIRGADRLARSRGLRTGLERRGVERPISEALGTVVFWVVLFFFLTAATDVLGLPVLTIWLTGIAEYLPRLLGAALILLVGIAAASLARDAVTAMAAAAQVAYARRVGSAARVVVLGAATLIAINQIGIDITILTVTVGVVMGAVLGGLALAFGLGARATVANLAGSHYLRESFRVGQVVRVAGAEGRIVAITRTAVILEGSDGRLVVPAGRFNDAVAVIVAVPAVETSEGDGA